MSETKKPTDDQAKTTPNEELSEEQLEQVAGGAALPTTENVRAEESPYLKITTQQSIINNFKFEP